MFCPRCSAQNRLEQKFCRNCGLSLSSVRLAVEGKVDEAKAELKRSADNLGPAAWTLGFFILASLGSAFFSKDWGVVIKLVLGALITVGWFYKGFKQAGRALEALEVKEQEQSADSAIASTGQSISEAAPTSQAELSLPAVPDTDPIFAPPAAGSIAEHTTFELKRREPR
jgi:hypothetical protein